jgi:hypothetical protein
MNEPIPVVDPIVAGIAIFFHIAPWWLWPSLLVYVLVCALVLSFEEKRR